MEIGCRAGGVRYSWQQRNTDDWCHMCTTEHHIQRIVASSAGTEPQPDTSADERTKRKWKNFLKGKNACSEMVYYIVTY